MLEEFDRLEVLIWEHLIIDYHENDGKLFEGLEQTYVTDIVVSIEGTYGLSCERCHEIVILFAEKLGVNEDNYERHWTTYYHPDAEAELTALLTAELTRSIDQEIMENLASVATEPIPEPIPTINLQLEERQVERQVRPLRAAWGNINYYETRDTGDG